MSAIGAAKGIGRTLYQFFVDSPQIPLGQHHIRIEHDKVLAVCALGSVIATLTRARVLLIIIMYVETAGITVAHVAAGDRRTVLDHHDLKVA